MGLMVDTNVFIGFERSGNAIDFSTWDNSSKVYISAVVVSELLMGVHRANTEERRQRRSKFVEAIISGVGVLDFTVAAAAHSCGDSRRAGKDGPNNWGA